MDEVSGRGFCSLDCYTSAKVREGGVGLSACVWRREGDVEQWEAGLLGDLLCFGERARPPARPPFEDLTIIYRDRIQRSKSCSTFVVLR